MPTVSGNVGAVFNGGTVTTPLKVEVAQGGAELFVVEDNTASEALSVQNDLKVQIGQAHAGLSAGIQVNPDSGGVFIQANSAAHSILTVEDENSVILIRCDDGTAPLTIKNASGVKMFELTDTGVGFFAHSPAAKPTISGAKLPSDVVLASLLTALAAFGLITDSTT